MTLGVEGPLRMGQGSTQPVDRAIVRSMRRGLVTGVLLGGLVMAGAAEAQESTSSEAGPATELTELEAVIGDLRGVLSSELEAQNCVAACEALGSMQRAADRICELEPGPRCERAQDDVEAARQRVQQACPDCPASRYDDQREEKTGADKPKADELGTDALAAERDDAAPEPAAAPPGEDARGGCAACAVGEGNRDGRGELAWLGLALALVWRRRRR